MLFRLKNPLITFLKKKIKEEEAAALFYLAMRKNIEEDWAQALNNLRNIEYGVSIEFKNENFARFELLLASCALDLKALENLFYPERAKRLHDWTIKHICTDAHDEYANYIESSIAEYIDLLKNADNKGINPLPDFGKTLYLKWGLENITTKIGNINITAPDPLLTMALASIMVSYIGKWKYIKENYKVID